MIHEESLGSQTEALREPMGAYRSMSLPGIDILQDTRECTVAKQAQWIARQYGSPGIACQVYRVSNWDLISGTTRRLETGWLLLESLSRFLISLSHQWFGEGREIFQQPLDISHLGLRSTAFLKTILLGLTFP